MKKMGKGAFTDDEIVQSLLDRMAKRSEDSMVQFDDDGIMDSVMDSVKSAVEWINEAQEEQMDQMVYLERLKIKLLTGK